MEIILVVILLIIMYCMYFSRMNKIMFLPAFIFTSMWCAILIMSSFKAYGLFPLSLFAVVLIAIHIFFFLFGYSFKTVNTNRMGQNNFHISFSSEKIYKSNILPIISLLFCIPLVILAYKYVGYVSLHSLESRSIRFETGALFKSTAEIVLYNYFCSAYFNIFSVIFIYGIISKKIKIKLFVPCLISLICYLVIGFGRIIFIQLLISIFIIFILSPKKRKKTHIFKSIILFLLACFVALVMIVMVTALRQGTNISASNFISVFLKTLEESFAELYRYTEGPLRAFDYSINNYRDTFGFHFGRMALAGFDEMIANVFKYFGMDFVSMNNLSSAITTIDVPIGNNTTIIALFSCLFDFYFDFGFAGVAIYSFIFGFLFAALARHIATKKETSIASIALYVFLIYIIVILPIKSIFGSPDTIITFFILLVWDAIDSKKMCCSSNSLRVKESSFLYEMR